MGSITNLALVYIILTFGSCVSIMPVNNHYEKAGTLMKGNIELSGHVTKYDINAYERTETSNRNYGFRAGYGVTDHFDFKLRYEKSVYAKKPDGGVTGADYISFIPKLSVAPENFAIMVPFSIYFVRSEYDNTRQRTNVNSIAPQMIFTLVNRKMQMDVSLSMKMDYMWESGYESKTNMFLGANLGAGFSTDLKKWAIRPEIGISTDDGDSKYISYGIGLQWIIPSIKK